MNSNLGFVRVPQYVQIHNIRIKLLLDLFNVGLIAVLAWRFVQAKQLEAESAITGQVNIEVTGTSDDDFRQLWADNMEKDFCKEIPGSGLYDYWADPDGADAHVSHTCRELCVEGYEDSGCTTGITTAVLSKSSQAFFPTRRDQEILRPSGQTSERSRIFYPGVEALHAHVTFSVQLPDTSLITAKPTYRSSWTSKTSQQLPVIVLTKGKSLWGRFSAGETIDITVAQLLELADVSLEDVRVSAGQNFHPNSTISAGPYARVSGLQLLLHVQCYDYAKYGVGHEADGSNCYVSVEETGNDWISINNDGVVDNQGTLFRDTYYGVVLHGHLTGTVRQLDLNSMWLNIAALIFMIRLPKKIMSHIVVSLFGHVSKIYSKVMWHPFSIMETSGSIAMRLMSYKMAFSGLASKTDSKDKKARRGIHEEQVGSHIEGLLEARELYMYNEDFTALEKFCYNALVMSKRKHPGSVSNSDLRKLANSVLSNLAQDFKEEFLAAVSKQHISESIDLDRFMSACLSNDDMTFDMMIELFSQRQQKSFLERFFMPENLKACMLESARIANIETQSLYTNDAAVRSIELHFMEVGGQSGRNSGRNHTVVLRQQPLGFAIHRALWRSEFRVSQVDPDGHGAAVGIKVGWILVGMDDEMFTTTRAFKQTLGKLKEKASRLPLESDDEARLREEMENHYRQAYQEEHNKKDNSALAKLEARLENLRSWTNKMRVGIAALHRAIRAPLMSVEFGDGATHHRELHEHFINKHTTNVKAEIDRLRTLAESQGKRIQELQAQLEDLQDKQKASEKDVSRMRADHRDIARYLDILEHNNKMTRRGSGEGNLAKTALQENREAVKKRILQRVAVLCSSNGGKVPLQDVLRDTAICDLQSNVVHSVRRLIRDYNMLFRIEVESEYFSGEKEVVTMVGDEPIEGSTDRAHSKGAHSKASKAGSESWFTRSLAIV
mmetsp:Transcript_60797/g.144860  ORF Transcript_60797/g.144860 Transcript_60797/m.144860 type:complete len:951 (-) Transcript_60797:45-2897(-)